MAQKSKHNFLSLHQDNKVLNPKKSYEDLFELTNYQSEISILDSS